MQASELHKRPHVVIATPGRLADHIESSGTVKNLFAKLTVGWLIDWLLIDWQFFVLDEADRLLGGQYGEQLATIFSVVPKQRQTLLFSATLTDALNKVQQVCYWLILINWLIDRYPPDNHTSTRTKLHWTKMKQTRKRWPIWNNATCSVWAM